MFDWLRSAERYLRLLEVAQRLSAQCSGRWLPESRYCPVLSWREQVLVRQVCPMARCSASKVPYILCIFSLVQHCNPSMVMTAQCLSDRVTEHCYRPHLSNTSCQRRLLQLLRLEEACSVALPLVQVGPLPSRSYALGKRGTLLLHGISVTDPFAS